uniref:Cytochrome c oxidase subunit 5B, mitochondrial n=1 Tax=Sphenodon punctatus TaxID=8508 RepID=A0A8D0GFT8_SPHPU
MMASRLLSAWGTLRALRAARLPYTPAWLGQLGWAGPVRAMSDGGIPSNKEQATGLERKVLEAIEKGVDTYNMFPPKRYPRTKEEPCLVPSVNKKRIVGCVCEEDNSSIIWFWLHAGDAQRCPSCGAFYKLEHQEMPH